MPKIPKLTRGDIIVIRWHDAWQEPGLHGSMDEIVPKSVRVHLRTPGIYMEEREGMIVCCNEHAERDLDSPLPNWARGVHSVPRVNVDSIRVLEKWQQKKKISKSSSRRSKEQAS